MIEALTKNHFLAVAAGGLYLILTLSLAVTGLPGPDEGFFANPAFNLIDKGQMATSVLEPAGSYITGSRPGVVLSGIRERTYWIMPLHVLAQVGWYSVVGFSTLSLRALSIVWSLVALLSWFLIVTSLFRDRHIAMLASLFVAFDYVFMTTASYGRMDMMCAALGFAALAFYLNFRERNLTMAILVSQALVVASVLTHPNGVMAFAAVVFLILYFDARSLSWRHTLIAALPHLVGAASWGLYILQSPADFLAQFTANAGMGRLESLTSPWVTIKREWTERYFSVYGPATGSMALAPLKILIPIAYFGSLAGSLFVPGLRRHGGYRVFLALAVIYFSFQISFNLKLHYYLVQTTPFLATALAACLYWLRLHRKAPGWLLTTLVLGVLSFQVAWASHGISQDRYQRWYSPVVDYLKSEADGTDLILGSAELALDLRFPDNFIHDVQLGYLTGRTPDIIVVSDDYEMTFRLFQTKQPELYGYITRLLGEEFRQVYGNGYYRIYTRREFRPVPHRNDDPG